MMCCFFISLLLCSDLIHWKSLVAVVSSPSLSRARLLHVDDTDDNAIISESWALLLLIGRIEGKIVCMAQQWREEFVSLLFSFVLLCSFVICLFGLYLRILL
jgi:hypothetical protein